MRDVLAGLVWVTRGSNKAPAARPWSICTDCSHPRLSMRSLEARGAERVQWAVMIGGIIAS